MPPTEHYDSDYHDSDNTVVDGDEEAQLLPTEELGFEDHVPTLSRPEARRPRTSTCIHGAQPPRIQIIRPIFPLLQNAPIKFIERRLPTKKHKIAGLAGLLLLWAFLFTSLLSLQLPLKDGDGRYVINLDCVDTLWEPKNACGLNGIDCRPFENDTFSFRCPAKCAGVQVLNPHPVGLLEINYRPFIIGDKTYRGDSFICGSAIHAGVVSDSKGGCGKITRVGRQDDFQSSKRNGLESIPFDSYFPLSFEVSEDPTIRCSGDPRQLLLMVSVLFTVILCVFSSSPAQFFVIFILIFAHVSFASVPPSASPHNISVLPDHLSMFAKRLLPALFCAVVLYWTVIKRTLTGMKAQIEKTVLWLGGFWFGALSNYTFDWIPISRLTSHDIEQQPGAKAALAVIIIILVFIIAQQVYCFWLEGRLSRYLALYGLFILAIIVFVLLPGVELRIHHYIIALLLLPGTSMQTRSSLVYQGILLGLFVNGIARWDFDSVLQTADALRGDGSFDSLQPLITTPQVAIDGAIATVAFTWDTPPAAMDGISALVNGVERYRSYFADNDDRNFTWARDAEMNLPEYIRFAYVKKGKALDYTKTGVFFPNRTWSVPERL